MTRRKTFLVSFKHPRFVSGYDQNQVTLSDMSQKKHKVVPRLMNFVLKGNKRKNPRLIDRSLKEKLDTINQVKNSQAEKNPSVTNAYPMDPQDWKNVPNCYQRKTILIARQLLFCLKPCFLEFGPWLKLGVQILRSVSENKLFDQSGTVDFWFFSQIEF